VKFNFVSLNEKRHINNSVNILNKTLVMTTCNEHKVFFQCSPHMVFKTYIHDIEQV